MDPVTAPMWLEALRIAPGIAGMSWLGYLAYKRSHDAEVHVQAISDKFLNYIERKDSQVEDLLKTFLSNKNRRAQQDFDDNQR